MTTFSDPSDALQVGIYELLSGDATLGALILGVFDGVPEDTDLSDGDGYIVVGELMAIPDGTHDGPGRQTSATVHTWTRAESHRPGNAIGARAAALLDYQQDALDAVVAGHKVWRIVHEFTQTLDDPEPGIRHRVDRFRVWTSQD